MRILTPILAASALLLPLQAHADDITDALTAAIEAYEAGDIADALDEMAYAEQLLQGLQAQGLSALLPEALEGWTRTINAEAGNAMAVFGGGFSAEASYAGPGGNFTLTLMADNPMVMQMGGMLGNRAMMAMMGEIVRINRENFVNQDGELIGLIGGRVLIQASGGAIDDMVAHVEQMDFVALQDFGR
ncbi:hypothetical protein [Roseicyclus mahoneyensis]|uniref:Uncharacterized protein n=1 Tax=Roseicyclus mahoneyensis TaxID=164332 RepID=A0A316GLN7_9RHOB|nr:hypothetical protein [Roseicyclus mahoneyensis]PWK60839.1 hypothetical protein C7455_10337 [Roseicyclus mahoneyensis]